MHDFGGLIEGIEANESAKAAEIKGKMMDEKGEEREPKDSNPHPGKESKLKKTKKNKQPKESEEGATTISGGDDKMKEDVTHPAGTFFSCIDYFLVVASSQKIS